MTHQFIFWAVILAVILGTWQSFRWTRWTRMGRLWHSCRIHELPINVETKTQETQTDFPGSFSQTSRYPNLFEDFLEAINILKEAELECFMHNLVYIIRAELLPLNNICFRLFVDLVNFFTVSDIRTFLGAGLLRKEGGARILFPYKYRLCPIDSRSRPIFVHTLLNNHKSTFVKPIILSFCLFGDY